MTLNLNESREAPSPPWGPLRKLAGSVAAMPVLIFVWVLVILKRPVPSSVGPLLWRLERYPAAGVDILRAVAAEHGVDAARARAQEMLQICPSGIIVGAMGCFDMQAGRHAEALDFARRNMPIITRDLDQALWVELVTSQSQNTQHYRALIDEILARRDLGPLIVMEGLYLRCWLYAHEGRTQEAEQIAERALEVQQHGCFMMIKWMCALQHGRHAQAEQYIEAARKLLTPLHLASLLAEHYVQVGDTPQAMVHLREVMELGGLSLDAKAGPLAELAQSEEFRDFCDGVKS